MAFASDHDNGPRDPLQFSDCHVAKCLSNLILEWLKGIINPLTNKTPRVMSKHSLDLSESEGNTSNGENNFRSQAQSQTSSAARKKASSKKKVRAEKSKDVVNMESTSDI